MTGVILRQIEIGINVECERTARTEIKATMIYPDAYPVGQRQKDIQMLLLHPDICYLHRSGGDVILNVRVDESMVPEVATRRCLDVITGALCARL